MWQMLKVMKWEGHPPLWCHYPWIYAVTDDFLQSVIPMLHIHILIVVRWMGLCGLFVLQSVTAHELCDIIPTGSLKTSLCCSLSLALLPSIMCWIVMFPL
jgi:hypothetical protein